MTGHLVFNGPERTLKFFSKDKGVAELKHIVECHDVGIREGMDPDPYGRECNCPPGMYFVGEPQACAIREPDGSVTTMHDDDEGFGCFFTPLADDPPSNAFLRHGRAGIGIHGGGSALPHPFAPRQGWAATLGCLRLQNIDNEQILVPYVHFIRKYSGDPDHAITLTVFWGARTGG